jgi:uncharacterized coiled-coil DUF342 family protein
MSAKLNVDIVAQLKDFNKAMTDLKSEVDDMGKKINKTNNEGIKSTNKLSAAFTNIGKTLAGVFAADMLINFGKSVINTTAEFQKMEAVLTNTLGSNSQAQQAMSQIVAFASKTPFQVNELTDSFVKLANRGFVPTMKEMTALGDLASSTGKSFDQLTEAALDAMTGEFERLKEFGVRAKSEGDKVQFTFKGVTTEVQKTDSAIKDYLISLGQAEGVSGAMAAISETVGGKISNLGDNVDQLKLTIGNQTSGVFAASIDWLSEFVKHATLSLKSISELKKEVSDIQFSGNLNETFIEVDNLVKRYKEIYPELSNTQIIDKAIDSVTESYRGLSKTALANGTMTVGELWKIIDELGNYGLKLKETAAISSIKTKEELEDIKKKAEAAKKAHDERIKQLRQEAAEVEKAQNKIFSKLGAGATRDAFNPQKTDVTKQMSPERLQMIQNATASILALNKQVALTLPGITIPEDAILRAKAYAKAQQKLAEDTALVAQNMGAALFVGDMFAQTLSNLAETGKLSFQGIFDALKQMVIRFAAAIAAAITLNILTGGAVMSAGGGKGLGSLIKGGKKYGIGGLTPFAAGGIVSGPTAALVGEYTGAKTNPEVIAPLSKLQNMMGGNVTFTISGDNLVGTLNRATKTRQRKF